MPGWTKAARDARTGRTRTRDVTPDGVTCSKCKELKAPEEFYVRRRPGCQPVFESHCRKCIYKKRMLQHRRRLYGMSGEQYDAMYQAQGGCCAICGDAHKVLHVDHDHSTGHNRALLCGPCNTGLGSFRESEKRFKAAIDYLRYHRQPVLVLVKGAS